LPSIRPNPKPKSILITGASSGIGEALSLAYAGAGTALALSGRNAERLAAVAERCRALGAQVSATTVDVAEREQMAAWITAEDERRPLDLVVANAGISGGVSGVGGEERVRRIFDVNVGGVLNTLLPAIQPMRQRGRGQLAIVSSVAGYRGMPGAPAYSASKAAVLAYGDALRVALEGDGISVSVVCPGFVNSRITAANEFSMPFLMTAEKAAGIIKRRLARGKGRIVFPWPMHLAARLLQAMPISLSDAILRRAPTKE
jgi:short-subunit dehydrogenase